MGPDPAAGAAVGAGPMRRSGRVIALRAAMRGQGLDDPLNADHREVARLLPERFAAVSAASMIRLQHAETLAKAPRVGMTSSADRVLVCRLEACRTLAASNGNGRPRPSHPDIAV